MSFMKIKTIEKKVLPNLRRAKKAYNFNGTPKKFNFDLIFVSWQIIRIQRARDGRKYI